MAKAMPSLQQPTYKATQVRVRYFLLILEMDVKVRIEKKSSFKKKKKGGGE